MDELTLIRDFRSEVPAPGPDSVRAARAALAARVSRRAPWWRRRLVVAIAVALLAAVGAGAALGLGDRLVDLFRSKPAPDSFQKMMEITHRRTGAAWRDRYEIAGEWRGVTATQTSIGPAGIYTAPTSNGELCWHAIFVDREVTVVRGHIAGACGPERPPRRFEVAVMSYQDTGRFPGSGTPTGQRLDILIGRVAPEINVLAVHLCGVRKPRRIPVRETFVLFQVPQGSEVDRLVALSRTGRRLGQTRPQGPGGAVTACL